MKKKYKALMLDLDGTTIPNQGNGIPSQKVQSAIKKAAKIISVGVATSRPYEIALPIIQMLAVNAPCIVSGGAHIIDPQTTKTLYEQPMLLADARVIGMYAKKNKLRMLYSDGAVSPFKKLPKKLFDLLIINDLTDKQAEQIITDLSHIPTIALYKVVSWNPGKVNVAISHASATKQHGIFEVAKQLKIDTHEIIGVGDGPNDFPLLMACGLKVAMGNAVDDLKAIADYVAPTVDEDGVAHVIEKFVLGKK